MSVNLLRNTRVFFSTALNTDGTLDPASISATNTHEIQVLEGLSFSQATATETITLDQAGNTPIRGQRQFNTALEPADFSFSTYIRPATGAEEYPLWDAFIGSGTAGSGTFTFANSNKHQLTAFALIILVDQITFVMHNCAMESATIDFGIDAISSIAWAGRATSMERIEGISASTNAFGGGSFDGKLFKAKVTSAPYIANKLTSAYIDTGYNAGASNDHAYAIALTGGSITFANNLTYLTPAYLGVVNEPCTYFTGTRSITGTFNAYLRTGTAGGDTGDLVDALLNSTADIDPMYSAKINIGGNTQDPGLSIVIPAMVPSVPTVSTDTVVSMEITFTAQGTTSEAFDITAENEATITYTA